MMTTQHPGDLPTSEGFTAFGTAPSWYVGDEQPGAWRRFFRQRERPYALYLSGQRAALLGASDAQLNRSLLRLAANAASHGWKVVFFDSGGSEVAATRFLAAMRQTGTRHIHLFPYQPIDGWRGKREALHSRLLQLGTSQGGHLARPCLANALSAVLNEHYRVPQSLDELTFQLVALYRATANLEKLGEHRLSTAPALRSAHVHTALTRYELVRFLLGGQLDGRWSYENTDAAYFTLPSAANPSLARALAQFLLADLASYLQDRSAGARRVLLILKHPGDLLSDQQDAHALFTQIQQAGGSVLLASTTPVGLAPGGQAARLLESAPITLVHSNTPLLSFGLPRVLSRNQARQASALGDDEVLVITHGRSSRLCLAPVEISAPALLQAHRCLLALPEPIRRPARLASPIDPFTLPLDPVDFDIPEEWKTWIITLSGQKSATHTVKRAHPPRRARAQRSKKPRATQT